MLGIGGFNPLDGFMGKADWEGVCDNMTMTNGLFWPIPVTLSTNDEDVQAGDEVAIVSGKSGDILATMQVTEKYSIDKAHECETVFKTTEDAHPGVVMVMAQGEYNLVSIHVNGALGYAFERLRLFSSLCHQNKHASQQGSYISHQILLGSHRLTTL
jgi:ATP sulfurylase